MGIISLNSIMLVVISVVVYIIIMILYSLSLNEKLTLPKKNVRIYIMGLIFAFYMIALVSIIIFRINKM